VRFGDFQFSVGKQAMWWGPTYDAPLSFSNNAEPLKSAKLTSAQPFYLPGVLRHLGEVRTEFVFGSWVASSMHRDLGLTHKKFRLS